MLTASPRVSVVLAARNASTWIEASVQSVLQQDYEDFELIVMDDGSTDETAEIALLAAGGDTRVRVIRGPSRGVSATRNAAMEYVRSDLIAVMDADDIALQRRLGVQLAHMDEHANTAIVGSWMRIIDEQGRTGALMTAPRWDDVLPRPFEDSFFLAHPTAVIRRGVFEQLGGYRLSLGGPADSDLWARAIDAGYRLDNLQEVLVLYRRHAGQSTVVRSFENAALMAARDLSRRIRHRGLPDPFDETTSPRISPMLIAGLPDDLASDAIELELAHEVAAELRTRHPSVLRIARDVVHLKRVNGAAQQLAIVCLEAAKAELLVSRRLTAFRWIVLSVICAPRYAMNRTTKRLASLKGSRLRRSHRVNQNMSGGRLGMRSGSHL